MTTPRDPRAQLSERLNRRREQERLRLLGQDFATEFDPGLSITIDQKGRRRRDFSTLGGNPDDLDILRRETFPKGSISQQGFTRALQKLSGASRAALIRSFRAGSGRALLADYGLDDPNIFPLAEQQLGRSLLDPDVAEALGPIRAGPNLIIPGDIRPSELEEAARTSRLGPFDNSALTGDLPTVFIVPTKEEARDNVFVGLAKGAGRAIKNFATDPMGEVEKFNKQSTDLFNGIGQGVVDPVLGVLRNQGVEAEANLALKDGSGPAFELGKALTAGFLPTEQETREGIDPVRAFFGIHETEFRLMAAFAGAAIPTLRPWLQNQRAIKQIARSIPSISGGAGLTDSQLRAIAVGNTFDDYTKRMVQLFRGRRVTGARSAAERLPIPVEARRQVTNDLRIALIEENRLTVDKAKAFTRALDEISKYNTGLGEFTSADLNLGARAIISSRLLTPEKSTRAVTSYLRLFTEGRLPTPAIARDLGQVFGPEWFVALERNRSTFNTTYSSLIQAVNLPRTIMANLDFSWPLYQGFIVMPRQLTSNTRETLDNFGAMFKSAFRPSERQNIDDLLRSRPHVQEAVDNGRIFWAKGPAAAGEAATSIRELPEELLAADWITRLKNVGVGKFKPFKPLAEIIEGSESAFVTAGNAFRASVYSQQMQRWERAGVNITEDMMDKLGIWTNVVTGRGSLGPLESSAELLTLAFFSPRLFASRFQIPYQLIRPDIPASLRREVAITLAEAVTTATGTLALFSTAPGVDVELDPRSADFGRVKIRNTRFDFLAGYQPIIRFLARAATGETISTGTDQPYPTNIVDEFLRLMWNKLAPVPSMATSFAVGHDPTGQPTSLDFNSFVRTAEGITPFIIGDAIDAVKQNGPAGILAVPPATFGVFPLSYESTGDVRDRVHKDVYGIPYSDPLSDIGMKRAVNDSPEVQKAISDSHKSRLRQLSDQQLQDRDALLMSAYTEIQDPANWGLPRKAAQFRALYSDAIATAAISSQSVRETSDQTTDPPEPSDAKNPRDQALYEYWKLFRTPATAEVIPGSGIYGVIKVTDPQTGEPIDGSPIDPDAMTRSIASLERLWVERGGEDLVNFVYEQVGVQKLPPELQEWEDLRKELRRINWWSWYQETPAWQSIGPETRALYEEMRAQNDDGTLSSFIDGAAGTYDGRTLDSETIGKFWANMEATSESTQATFRQNHPDLDWKLFRWRGTLPVTWNNRARAVKELRSSGMDETEILRRILTSTSGSRISDPVGGISRGNQQLPNLPHQLAAYFGPSFRLEDLAHANPYLLSLAIKGAGRETINWWITQAKEITSRLSTE